MFWLRKKNFLLRSHIWGPVHHVDEKVDPDLKLLLTLCRSMEFSIKFDTVKSGWSIVYIEES